MSTGQERSRQDSRASGDGISLLCWRNCKNKWLEQRKEKSPGRWDQEDGQEWPHPASDNPLDLVESFVGSSHKEYGISNQMEFRIYSAHLQTTCGPNSVSKIPIHNSE